jgi:hypothetical protein
MLHKWLVALIDAQALFLCLFVLILLAVEPVADVFRSPRSDAGRRVDRRGKATVRDSAVDCGPTHSSFLDEVADSEQHQ